MSRIDVTEEWILEDLAAITGKDIKELRKSKSKTKSTPVNRHKYFRRPGKRHNNDFCFSCREGGTLICCDGCTKSFHLLCLDPPMEDDDIPEGEWLCKTCKLGKPCESEGVISLKFLSRKRRRALEDENTEESKEAKLMRCVWSQLIRKALESDPKEYENPLDCRTIPYIFPGDSKNSKKNQMKQKYPHSTQCYICRKGLSKQSMINCDYCERSFHLDCTDPPLTIPPKYFWMCQFHIEPCLESLFYREEMPSLSQRIALWDMCRKPIDHEAVKLEFLRNTVTDKNKLVQLPTVPIEIPDAVYNHYNNRPDMIPSLKEALRLVGYDQSMEFLQRVPSSTRKQIATNLTDNEKTSKEEQELWLSTILGFQKDLIAKLSDEMVESIFENRKEKFKTELEERKSEIVEKIEESQGENSNCSDNASCQSKSSNNSNKIKIKRPHDEITKLLEAAIAELPEADECLNIMNYLDEDFINVLAFQRLSQFMNYNKLKSKLIEEKSFYDKSNLLKQQEETNSLLNPQLQQFIGFELKNTLTVEEASKPDENLATLTLNDGESYQKVDKENFISSLGVEVKIDDETIKEDETVVNAKEIKAEAVESNEEVISGDPEDIKQSENKETNVQKITQSQTINLNELDETCENKLTTVSEGAVERVSNNPTSSVSMISFHDGVCGNSKILGVLTAVKKQTELFPIFKSGFVIGRGSSVNLDLDRCGHCNFISNHHAVMYVDERTHLWEIINYSRFGCRVNNILLSFDVPKKALNNILDEDSDDEICSFHQSIKDISTKQSALLDVALVKNEKEQLVKQFYKNPCQCDPREMHRNMSSNGWNNSVPFSHGSLLQFGCIGLVFGDTSYVTP